MSIENDPLGHLPRAHGESLGSAAIRQRYADFQVIEVPLVEASGEGEHCLVRVRKEGMTTAQVAQELASHCGLKLRQVSWAGLKDRYAQTEQWFSLHLPGQPDPEWAAEASPSHTSGQGRWQVLDQQRHNRKLRIGALAGNQFSLRLREMQADTRAVEQRLEVIRQQGVPNYFGQQRFGRRGDNVQQALQRFANGDRRLPAMLMSAVRSELFNLILAERVSQRSWNQPIIGDAMQLAGSNSFFIAEQIETDLQHRVQTADIHPCGSLWGNKAPLAQGRAGQLELHLASEHPQLVEVLSGVGMSAAVRSLRVMVAGLQWQWLDKDLQLQFQLPPGAYATMVLRELLDVVDPHR